MEFSDSFGQYFVNNPLESLGFGLTLLGIWLNVQQNIWGWAVGAGGIICYLLIFFRVELYGDFTLQIYFFLTSIYGFWAWQQKPDQSGLPITRLSDQERLFLAGIVLVGTVLAGFVLSFFNPSFAYPDAFTTVLSVIAQWLLARKKLENWLLWILANLVYVFIYYYKNLYLTCFLYFLLLGLALQGFWQWRNKLQIKEE